MVIPNDKETILCWNQKNKKRNINQNFLEYELTKHIEHGILTFVKKCWEEILAKITIFDDVV